MKAPEMIAAEIAHGSSHEPVPSSIFAIRNLSVLAYANGFTLWHYKAGNARLDAVATPNFFQDSSDMLSVGDMMMVSASDGGRMMVVIQSDKDYVNVAWM